MYLKNIYFILLLSIFISGCTRDIPTPNERLTTINSLMPNSFESEIIQTSKYKFYTIHNVKNQCENINVYFEGDGLSWITRTRVSDNPTPINPTAFKLMLTDNSNCSVYVARACQYTNDNSCKEEDWTSHRFSYEIMNGSNDVINKIKEKYKPNSFNMIGYSGGAAIASLVSNKRDDVKTLITIAGNLNTTLWTDIKNITALSGSLNPIDNTNNLQNVKQYHLIGQNDNVIPKEILQSYMNNFNDKSKIVFKSVDATHSCCYENEFKNLIQGLK